MWAHVSTLLPLQQPQTAEATRHKEASESEVEISRNGERDHTLPFVRSPPRTPMPHEGHKAVGSVRYTGAYHQFVPSLTLSQTAPVSTDGQRSVQNINVSCRTYHSLT